ncbi:MAG: DEAD/DEAH box helicase [Alphaproteobacteria bacterium]|nr:DEAD/DEAH box helicase [Alphaproteobacteria bacterium]
MTYDELRETLETLETAKAFPFECLKTISEYVNCPEKEQVGRELVVRALAVREAFSNYNDILVSLVRGVGLFPYLKDDVDTLNFSDRLAYELHKADNLDDDIVLHRLQFEVYNRLMRDENIILSAPTSAGKSLLIDALIASGKYQNLIIIVPTLALIDETRKRLLQRFSNSCKIITHHSQKRSKEPDVRNVYVLTQERVLEREDLKDLDLFIMDEFYKIDFKDDNSGENDRALLLNRAFHQLATVAKQFYLLGPNIEEITGIRDSFSCHFKNSNFSTVAVNYKRFDLKNKKEEKEKKLVELCQQIDLPILVYCQSPNSAHTIAKLLLEENVVEAPLNIDSALEWITANYHKDWIFHKALEAGIGIHHGSIPRALQQECVKYFNEGKIKILVCTSTFIEGVNSEAKSIIIYDRRIANNKALDYFTYRNIEGRAGRMFKHFVGSVYSLETIPPKCSVEVDFPICHQDETTPLDLLVQIDIDHLHERSKQRLNDQFSHMLLPEFIVKQNAPVPITNQEAIAQEIHSNIEHYAEQLLWNSTPDYEQLKTACELICSHISKPKSIVSVDQLAYVINRFFMSGSYQSFLDEQIEKAQNDGVTDISKNIDQTLTWVRNVISYSFPRNLMIIETIANYVFKRNNIDEEADYSFYSSSLENLHMDSALCALDEYGIPYQTAQKLGGYIDPQGELDLALEYLRVVDVPALPFLNFEKTILMQIQSELQQNQTKEI